MPFLLQKLSTSQCKDSGLALTLINLVLALVISPLHFLPIGTVLLIVTMTAPRLFLPFAKFWFSFSNVLGNIVSRVFLTVLFFVMVTPVGLLRRALGKDSMQLKKWRESQASVFQVRNHLYEPRDLDHPY